MEAFATEKLGRAQASEIAAAVIVAGAAREIDPLLDACGVRHKALIEIKGEALIARAARALGDAGFGERIVIAAPGDLHPVFADVMPPGIAPRFTEAQTTPAATLLELCAVYEGKGGVLATTADHALLTPEMLQAFLRDVDDGTGVAAAVVDSDVYHNAFPNTRQPFVRLKDARFTGANLFWMDPALARPLFEFWRSFEKNRRAPLKMVRAVGLAAALSYLRGALSEAEVIALVEERTGVRGQFVRLEDAKAAIDIARPEDLEVARRLL
ncbi:MAG: NTP transferase domain-containing protein [Pseudomonadota bacterium]